MEESKEKTTVEVVINGEIITMTGVESEEYIQKLARYIDKKITDIQKEKKIISFNTFIKTLMLAINIADDLHKEIDKKEVISKNYEKTLGELGKMQEENVLLKDKVRAMQTNLTNTEKEIDEYVETFVKEAKVQTNNTGNVNSKVQANNTGNINSKVQANNTGNVNNKVQANNTGNVNNKIQTNNTGNVNSKVQTNNAGNVNNKIQTNNAGNANNIEQSNGFNKK